MSKEPYSPEFQKLFDSYHTKFQDTLKEWSRAFSTTKEFEDWWTEDQNEGRKIPDNPTVDIYADNISAPKVRVLS